MADDEDKVGVGGGCWCCDGEPIVDEYFLRSNCMPLLALFKLECCFVGFLKNNNL